MGTKLSTVEVWQDIPSWQGLYQASSFGRIRSLANEREVQGRWGLYKRFYGGQILSPKTGAGNYLYVNLWNANKGHMRAVHRLVCEAFNPIENWDNLVINHKDHNRQNNHQNNLEFVTQQENLQKAATHYGFKTIGQFLSKCKTGGGFTLPTP